MQAEASPADSTLSPAQLQALQQSFETQWGLDFSGTRSRNLQAGIADLAERLSLDVGNCAQRLVEQIAQGAASCAPHFTVAETYFFREARAFELIAELARQKLQAPGPLSRLRIWSAGCCTGEEAYSAAITLQRALSPAALAQCSVLGTDINPEALQFASNATYGRRSFRQAEAPAALHFAALGNEQWQVRAPARNIVHFASHNLADEDWPLYLQGMDVILCRNVLMYFSPAQARRCIARLRDCLVEGGWLIVSPSEATSELYAGFEAVRHPDAIWFRKTSARPQSGQLAGRSASGAASPTAVLSDRAMYATAAVSPAVSTSGVLSQAVPRPALRTQTARPVRAPQPTDQANDDLIEHTQDRQRALDYCVQASARAEAGDLDAACAQLRRALYLDPDCVLAAWLMGMQLTAQGKPAQARAQLQSAIVMLRGLPPESAIPGAEDMRAGGLREAATAMLAKLESVRLSA